MGDLLSPKRRDVFDRLRRRIEQYRRHNQHNLGRFEGNLNGLYEQQQHDTALLQQRWVDSKAKRNQKNKTSNNSGNNASNQQQGNNQTSKELQERSHALTQQKLKRKLDANTATSNNPNNTAESASYNFDDGVGSPPPNKANKQDSSRDSQVHSSLSVNIVQQINTQSEHAGTSQIKVTLTSNLQTGGGLRPDAQTSTSVETKTNVCKSEPVDDSQCAGPSSSSSHASIPDPSIGLEDIDDLQAILETLEKEEGEIPPEFMKDLELLRDINSETLNTDEKDDTLSNKNQMFSGTNTKRSSGPGMFAEPALYDNSSSSQGSGSVVNNGMGGPSAASVVNYPRPPTGGGAAVHPQVPQTPPMLGDTGPAAETLKQMAAQHQNQNYGMKSQNYAEFPDGYARRGMMPPHGYSQYPQQYNMANPAAQSNMYYGPQTPNAMGNVRPPYPQGPGMHPGMGIKPDPSISYGGTKPLSHYPVEALAGGAQGQNGPSSLQQLQNQVQSTFNHQGQNAGHPGPQGMQINQSQQMHMSHGSQRMQLSQTQQMQIHAGSNISVAQQQSFSMNPQGMHPQQQHPQYMNPEQMKMHQMYRDQQQRHMQTYMNRPPPEYKVPPGGMPAGNYGVPNGMGNANPMQNMQKMVNQTNHATSGQNGMYPAPAGGTMKTEQTGGMPAGQGSVPSHSGSSGSPANLPCQPNTPTEGAAPNMGSYPNAAAQQQPPQMMQGQHIPRHSMPMSTQNRPNKPGTPTYTSAILRGQRPPNVNVGPEGLNISQQRPHSAEWHRQGMAQGPGGSPMPQTGGMAYGYQGQAMSMQAGPGGPRMAMAQQQHAMQHNAPNAQQQHRMAMMQQMHSSQQQSGQAMSQAMPTTSTPTSQQQQQQAPTPHSQQAQSYPPQQQPQQQGAAPNGNAEYIPLDFLDNQQTGNSDFFNSVVPDSNSTDIFDELFGSERQ